MTCVKCQHQTCKKFGYFGKRRIQRWRCNSRNSTFCEAAPKLGAHYTDPETAAKVLSLMLEGMSVRAISRVTGLHKGTIPALMNTAAANVTRLMSTRMRGIRTRYIQSDEIWCFVGKKRRHVRKSDPTEVGDQWVLVAMDAETKLVPSFVIGKCTRETTLRFFCAICKHA
jgi:transposase-like protein